MANPQSPATTTPDVLRTDIAAPTVSLALTIGNMELVSIGVVKAKNALNAALAGDIAAIKKLDERAAGLEADRKALVDPVDDPGFLEAVDRCVAAVVAAFGLDGVSAVKVQASLRSYDRHKGRTFAATVSYGREPGQYESAASGEDGAILEVSRTAPTPAAVAAIEAELDGIRRRRDAVDQHARRLRVQIGDRQGIEDQVRADLAEQLLGQAGDTGRAMLAALVAPQVAGATNPVLALLDGRSDG